MTSLPPQRNFKHRSTQAEKAALLKIVRGTRRKQYCCVLGRREKEKKRLEESGRNVIALKKTLEVCGQTKALVLRTPLLKALD